MTRHRIRQQVGVLDEGILGGAKTLARQLVECLARLFVAQPQDGIIDGVAGAQRFGGDGHGLLVGGDADIAEADVVALEHEVNVFGIIAEPGREEGEVGGHAAERGAAKAAGRRDDGVTHAVVIGAAARCRGHADRPGQRCAAAD